MNHYCRSVNIDGKLTLKISAVFKSDSLNITILKNETAWNCIVSKDGLTEQSKKLQISFDEYYVNLRKYIECGLEDTEFEFKSGKFSINVRLKNKMKMLYFQCQPAKVNFIDTVYGEIDALYDTKVEYYKKLCDISNKHTMLKNDCKIMEMKLDAFLERRESDELKLYNNFIVVLNEKKMQIQHLNDLLIALRQGRPTVNPPVQVKRKRGSQPLKNKKNSKNISSLSESEVDRNSNDDSYDTNDEAGQSNDNITLKENRILSPIPSTSRLKDDSPSPHHSLPDSPPESLTFAKRIRKDNGVGIMDIIVPKKESSFDQKHKDTSQESQVNEALPRVDFNTQDLLDNL